MARSITDPYWQARALVAVAGALAEVGQHEQAATVAARATAMARSITNPDRQAEALAAVAGVLAEAGQHEQAADRGPLHHQPGPARRRRWRRWPRIWPGSASTSRPSPWPAPSPTRTGRRGRWRR